MCKAHHVHLTVGQTVSDWWPATHSFDPPRSTSSADRARSWSRCPTAASAGPARTAQEEGPQKLTRLERQLAEALFDLLAHPEAGRCRMDGCRLCLPIENRIREVLTTVQLADAVGDRPHRPPQPEPSRPVQQPAERRHRR
ncbi:MAG TPA: hypothetical protein VFH48_22435 [Chloroflexota bacterium]|nr:hypothetical protein [Chloroflexota bacterium]